MASEDLFKEEFSEEIVYTENANTAAENVIDEEEIEEDLDFNEEDPEGPTEADEDITEDVIASDENADKTNEEFNTKSGTLATNQQDSKLFQLPLTRIRNLMKLDPDFSVASNEAVFLVTKATERFIESLAVESFSYTAQMKKKTIQKRDVDLAISAVDSLMFLEGAMNF